MRSDVSALQQSMCPLMSVIVATIGASLSLCSFGRSVFRMAPGHVVPPAGPVVFANPLHTHVYVDPDKVTPVAVGDLVHRKFLVKDGEVAHMGEMTLDQLAVGARALFNRSSEDTHVYFGLGGHCSMNSAGERVEVKRGTSVLVRPGTQYEFVGGLEEPCLVLSTTLHSGPWMDKADSAAGGAAGAAPSLWMAEDGLLQSQKTAHESALLSKRVHVRKGLVPGLMQVSIAKFQAGAVCELHQHSTATEVYVNYAGKGCHLRLLTQIGEERTAESFDLTNGKVDAINPGTLHDAWNDAGDPCENINFMLADPHE